MLYTISNHPSISSVSRKVDVLDFSDQRREKTLTISCEVGHYSGEEDLRTTISPRIVLLTADMKRLVDEEGNTSEKGIPSYEYWKNRITSENFDEDEVYGEVISKADAEGFFN